jgi:hypothetical protein
MVLPPLLPGAAKFTVRLVPLTVIEEIVGAPGVVKGVPASASEIEPTPLSATARSLTEYVVPLTKPEITIGDAVDIGLRTCQLLPPSTEN